MAEMGEDAAENARKTLVEGQRTSAHAGYVEISSASA